MARRLRKKRVAAALIILLLIIGGICMLIFKACGKDDEAAGTTTSTESGQVTTENGGGSGSDEGEGTNTTVSTPQIAWPNEMSNYIKEYSGAGNMVAANNSTNDEGKTVYTVQYKGTSIDSCFSYSKNTLEMSGEWTEEVTGELYSFHRETEKFILGLRCEPKAANGYDFQIKLTVK